MNIKQLNVRTSSSSSHQDLLHLCYLALLEDRTNGGGWMVTGVIRKNTGETKEGGQERRKTQKLILF